MYHSPDEAYQGLVTCVLSPMEIMWRLLRRRKKCSGITYVGMWALPLPFLHPPDICHSCVSPLPTNTGATPAHTAIISPWGSCHSFLPGSLPASPNPAARGLLCRREAAHPPAVPGSLRNPHELITHCLFDLTPFTLLHSSPVGFLPVSRTELAHGHPRTFALVPLSPEGTWLLDG